MPLFINNSSQVQQQHHLAPVKSSPLDIPELLEVIFSYLGRRFLQKHISLVCRQWYNIAKKTLLFTRTLTWILDGEQTESQLKQMTQRLYGVQTLKFHSTRDFYITLHCHKELDNAFHDICSSLSGMENGGQLQVKELDISLPVNYETHLFPLLGVIGSFLTSLELSELEYLEIPLQGILSRCPRLLNLKLEGCSDSLRSRSILSDQIILNQSLLRSLTLKYVSVDSTDLMQVLRSNPNMEELQLIEIMNINDSVPGPESITSEFISVLEKSFMREVAQLCPRLKKAHLSNSSKTSIPGLNSKTINQLLSTFPHVVDWGFIGFDLCSTTRFRTLNIRTNSITSLEMVGRLEFVDKDRNCFHEFLCDSPHLIHLKAPEVLFPTLFLDLEGTVDWVKWNPKRTIGTQRSIKPYHRKIWACRNLRTLHMRFLDSASEHSTPEARSRLVFGYISKVCPRLQDLVIRKLELDMRLEGGFCLLSRLQELERLKITSEWKGRNRHASEVDWVSRETSQTLRIRMNLWITKNNFIEPKTFYATSPFQCSTNACSPFHPEGLVDTAVDDGWTDDGWTDDSWTDDHMIDGVDMRYLGRLKDITMCFQDRLSNNMLCWPRMESIRLVHFEYNGKGMRNTGKSIKSFRPDVLVEWSK